MGLSRYGKLQVAAEVVKLWRSQSPAGRFLAMTTPTQRDDTTWHDIGDKEAIKKTSQCLRERIPAHQKARTLPATKVAQQKARALVEKTKKTTAKLNQMSSQQAQQVQPLVAPSHAVPLQPQNHCREQSQFSQWLQQQEQSMRQDLMQNSQQRALCQPTPIVENGTVSQVNSNISNVDRYATVSPLDTCGGDKQFMISAPTTTSSMTLPQQEQDWPGTVSQSESMGSDLEEWMTDAAPPKASRSLRGDDTVLTSSSLLRRMSSSKSTKSDTSLIPSAANLTRDAFGEDSTTSSSDKKHKRFSYHRCSSGASDVSCMSGPFMIQDDNNSDDDDKAGEEALDRMMEDYQTKSSSSNTNNTVAPTTLNQSLSLSSGFTTGLNSDLFAW